MVVRNGWLNKADVECSRVFLYKYTVRREISEELVHAVVQRNIVCDTQTHDSGRSAAWLARLNGVQEVASSNLAAPTFITPAES